MTHDVSPSLRLGSLTVADLDSLAADWLDAGCGDRLAEASERTWAELTGGACPLAVYWYDEVAARTRESAFALGGPPSREPFLTPA